MNNGSNANTPKVIFFMIVTDRDIIIADFAVKSYARIQGIGFRLLIYSNWLSVEIKKEYFPRWEKLPYVDIQKNEWQDKMEKPTADLDPTTKPGDGRVLIDRFDRPYSIWDRELKKIGTPYVATADADFEILDGCFVTEMIKMLDSDARLALVSTDYSPLNPRYFDTYSKEEIVLNERWHTWFCIYRKEVLSSEVSFLHHEIQTDGPIRRLVWDDHGFFQKALKDRPGMHLRALDAAFQPCFIHYGAFNKNRSINQKNIGVYRFLRIVGKRGIMGLGGRVVRGMANRLVHLLFPEKERLSYKNYKN
jgi:hypothetical protein